MVIFVALKICNDNFVFYITHMKYFDVLCYFLLLILVCLYILVRNKKIFNKISEKKWQKVLILFVSFVFISFLTFMFLWLLNVDSFNGCSIKYEYKINHKINETLASEISYLDKNMIIIIGDSRMSLIKDDSSIQRPSNFQFVAESGMKIDWLKKEALSQVDNIVNEYSKTFHVVVNMGVNDLDNVNYKGDEIAQQYFDIYKSLSEKYPKINIYILSVNPIDEKIINDNWDNNRTNKKIKTFNKTMVKEIKRANKKNMYYCDSYNSLKFKTYDGLHYTKQTDRNIINYIINKCVKF